MEECKHHKNNTNRFIYIAQQLIPEEATQTRYQSFDEALDYISAEIQRIKEFEKKTCN